jgi:hypothetical protein
VDYAAFFVNAEEYTASNLCFGVSVSAFRGTVNNKKKIGSQGVPSLILVVKESANGTCKRLSRERSNQN